jgi:hypothetical protein
MMTDEFVKLSPPQFLKGHPRNDAHMKALVDYLPEAVEQYVPVAKTPAAPSKAIAPAPPAPCQPVSPSAPAAPAPALAPSPPPEVTEPPAPAAKPPAQPSPPPETAVKPIDTGK